MSERGKNGMVLLPTEPLRSPLRAAASELRYVDSRFHGGLRALAQAYAARFGTTDGAAERLLCRVLSRPHISFDNADNLAVFLGKHPLEIWGDEWFTIEPPKARLRRGGRMEVAS